MGIITSSTTKQPAMSFNPSDTGLPSRNSINSGPIEKKDIGALVPRLSLAGIQAANGIIPSSGFPTERIRLRYIVAVNDPMYTTARTHRENLKKEYEKERRHKERHKPVTARPWLEKSREALVEGNSTLSATTTKQQQQQQQHSEVQSEDQNQVDKNQVDKNQVDKNQVDKNQRPLGSPSRRRKAAATENGERSVAITPGENDHSANVDSKQEPSLSSRRIAELQSKLGGGDFIVSRLQQPPTQARHYLKQTEYETPPEGQPIPLLMPAVEQFRDQLSRRSS